jgi:hypothetical protein
MSAVCETDIRARAEDGVLPPLAYDQYLRR